MIKILFFLVVLTALAFGFAWIADQPGSVSIAYGGSRYEMDLVVAIGIGLALLVAAMVLWSIVRFIFRIPTLMSLTARMRRRNKGFAALSRGMVAAGAGDAKAAARAARDAEKLMGGEPLALLLSAQAAQLSGDRAGAERVFQRMTEQPETRVLGLRGLYAEARRRGDDSAAHDFARQAHDLAALPWAGQAMLERHALSDDWKGALAIVETNLARKAITRATADRQRAVLKTAMAEQLRDRDPAEALALAREAIKLAPDLTPASALAGSLLAQKGDLRRAGRILEAAWKRAPHPDLARAYVEMRHGDAAGDRLNRAKALGRIAPGHAESQLAIARAALETRDLDLARRTMGDLMDNGRRPTVRMCLMMADIEETEHGPTGRMREWLARAARAPRDPTWVADGVVSDRWLPASPVTGQIDAFRWETPVERLGAPADEPPLPVRPEEDARDREMERATARQIAMAAPALGAAAANETDPAPAPASHEGPTLELEATSEPVAPEPAASAQADPAPAPAASTEAETPAPAPAPPPTEPPAAEKKAEPAEASDAPEKPSTVLVEPPDAPSPPLAAGANGEPAPREATGKSPLPERLVTAPDDPGLDEAADAGVPVKPRKRGFFG